MATQPDRRTSARETLRLRAVEPIFTVTDIERSVRFYTDVLGFVVDEKYNGENGKLQGVMLKAGVCRLGLCAGLDRVVGELADAGQVFESRFGVQARHRPIRVALAENKRPAYAGLLQWAVLGSNQ